MKYDQYEYIRNYYGVPIKKGAKVIYKSVDGSVTGVSGPHAMIKLDGEKHAKPYHPKDENLVWVEAANV